MLVLGAIALLLVAVSSMFFRVVVLPTGNWAVARMGQTVTPQGQRYRTFIVGVNAIIRLELDTDGDGVYDLRGDDWQGARPVWCWKRGATGWEETPPAQCELAWRYMQGQR